MLEAVLHFHTSFLQVKVRIFPMAGLGPSVVLVRKCKLLTLRCEANSMTKTPIWLVGQWYALNVREDPWSMG
ncbi:MAG TPA: hypothetical protein DGJ56_08370 [Verrucomicrobiales bacterium]|nr:hypothetical protein [Verrucomicrobiales bacterium]